MINIHLTDRTTATKLFKFSGKQELITFKFVSIV